MVDREIPPEYRGWWRIIGTSTWGSEDLDIIGTALISFTGGADRLRMHCLLAHVNAKPTKAGVSFTWTGAWEYDEKSGTGTVKLDKNGRLQGTFRIKQGEYVRRRAGRGAPTTDPRAPELPRQVETAVVTAQG